MKAVAGATADSGLYDARVDGRVELRFIGGEAIERADAAAGTQDGGLIGRAQRGDELPELATRVVQRVRARDSGRRR